MYISTFYGVVKQNNGYFKIFYPVYSNGDISPVVNGSEFNSFSTAHNQADLAYLDLQSALSNVDNISVYGNYELLYENNNYLIQQVVLEVNLNQSSEPDYTNILTDINTNLSNLNTNITNKNNQSDIVDCLNNIFCFSANNNFVSCIKSNEVNVNNQSQLKNANITTLLFGIYAILNSASGVDYNDLKMGVSNRALDNISKKLSLTIPSDENNPAYASFKSLFYKLLQIFLTSSATTNADFRTNSLIKQISEKLANANDLHTISQAIDLISTAIAQLPATDTTGLQTELGKISTAVNNIENNPLFELNANVNGIEVCKKNNKNELDF